MENEGLGRYGRPALEFLVHSNFWCEAFAPIHSSYCGQRILNWRRGWDLHPGVHPMVFVNYFAAAGIVLGPICSYLSGHHKKLLGNPGTVWISLFLSIGFGFPLQLPLNLKASTGETWTWHTKRDWPLLVLLAVFSVAGQALMNLGLTLETAAKATAMNYSQVTW